jgi:hypothetical protein
MVFGTSDNDTMSISLRYPKDDLTPAEVQAAMQTIIDNSVFVDDINSILSAEITNKTVTELIG